MGFVRRIKKALSLVSPVNSDMGELEFCDKVRRLYALDREATEVQRANEREEIRFMDPDKQWSEDDRRLREDAKRPCLTEDRTSPFIAQVANEVRQNRPMIQISPTSEGSRQETAEVIQGLVRHIETDSGASAVYDDAFNQACQTGRGFYRLIADYTSPESFEQEVKMQRIASAESVFIDPSASEPDLSDMKWAGIASWVWREDYMSQYPDSKLAGASSSSWGEISEDAPDWMHSDGGAVLVVEFYCLEPKHVTICRLEDGSVVEEKDLPEGVRPVTKRKTTRFALKWYKLNPIEILDQKDLPGSLIPIIPVLGKEVVINEHRCWHGLIHHAKDPQRRYNHLITAQVERLAFTPLGGWVGVKGAFGEGKQREAWRLSNRTPIAFLEANPVNDVNGQPLPLPKWESVEPAIGSVNQALQFAQEGMKATTGMYDASMGNREANQSGVAIQRLQRQGQVVNYHLIDNLARANRYAGKILLQWIPVYYDTERVIRIIGEDDTAKLVKINGQGDETDKEGKPIVHDFTIGEYDVVVNTGPGYQTKRQEDLALFMEMLQGPMGQQIAATCPDLAVSMMDSRAGKLMQERLKKTLPPELQDKEDGKQQVPSQIQQMLQQMSQQHEMLTAKVHEQADELESRREELSSKEAIAMIEARTKLISELIKLDAEQARFAAEQELQMIDARLASRAQKDAQAEAPQQEQAQASPQGQPQAQDTGNNAGAMPPVEE